MQSKTYTIDAAATEHDRRERRKAQTRRDLVDAAEALFAVRGFERTTVEDIAEAAKVSPRTFFRYFATKEEVLFSNQAEELRTLKAELARRPPDEPPLVSIREALLRVIRMFEEDREFHLFRFRLTRQTPSVEAYALHLHQSWIREITGLLAERLGVDARKDLRPNFIAGCATMAMRSALVPWAFSRGQRDLLELTREAFEILERGLGEPI